MILRRPGANRRGLRGFGAPNEPNLAARSIERWDAAGWELVEAYHANRMDTLTIGAGDRVSAWVSVGTRVSIAAQGTDGARPTYEATGLNSRKALSFDGGDHLLGGTLDLSAFTAVVVSALLTDSITGTAVVIERTATIATSEGGFGLFPNNGAAGDFAFGGRVTAGYAIAQTAAGAAPLTTATVITGTWDRALATNETTVLIDGVDATSSRPFNTNTGTAGFGNYANYIGARGGSSLYETMKLAALHIACGTTAIPAATLAADVADMRAEWGL